MTKANANKAVKQIQIDGETKILQIDDVQVETRAAEGPDPLYDFTQPLTADLIDARVTAMMTAAYAVFNQEEVRFLTSGGKMIAKDWNIPDGETIIDAAGNESSFEQEPGVLTNVNAFDTSDLLGAICWKLETKLDKADQRVASKRSQLRSMLSKLDRPDNGVTEHGVEVTASILERMIEQQAFTLIAFKSALRCYADLLGHEYETAAMRAERNRLGDKPTGKAGNYAHLLG